MTLASITEVISRRVAEKALCWCEGRSARRARCRNPLFDRLSLDGDNVMKLRFYTQADARSANHADHLSVYNEVHTDAMNSAHNLLRRPQMWLVSIFVLCAYASAQTSPIELRYHLKSGDRLVYREVFDREGKSPDTSFHSRIVLFNQVMVMAASNGSSLVGIQRNRQSADLLEFRDHGKDVLAEQKPAFEKRIAARPARFADSNVFSVAGYPLLPSEVIREARSKLLYRINEIMPLPATPVQVGTEWDSEMFGMRLRLESFQPVGQESCALVADTGNRKDMHLRFTFCPASGQLAKLDFDGQYLDIGTTMRERITIELVSAEHGETPESWLTRADTRLGALNAYLISTTPLPPASVMNEILTDGTHDAQTLALAAYYQRNLSPATDALTPLLRSENEEVRRLAGRFSQSPPLPGAQPCTLPKTSYKRERDGTTLRGMTTAAFRGAPFIMHVPLDYRADQPFPLIVYLSGGGGLALDGALNLGEALAHAGYLVLIPNASGDLWWQSTPTETVHALLLEVLRSYNVDTNHVYLVGFSNGGTAVLEFGTRWPDRFAAVVSLMGAGLDTPSGTKLPLQNLLDVPVLLVHGDRDTLIPASSSYAAQSALRSLKPRVSPELHILKGRGHDIRLADDGDFTVPFLRRFSRDPFPSSVQATFFDSRFTRQYWVEVLQSGKDATEVQARILAGNLIDIDTRQVKKLRLLLRPELFAEPGPVRIRLNGKEQPPVQLKHDCEMFQQSAQTYADPFLAYTDEVILEVP
jgi:dienelactone hydrolase